MNIAILKNNEVVNVTLFSNIETAQYFLAGGVWTDIGADSVEELPDGFGIGDSYKNGVWEKAPAPEPPEPPTEPETLTNEQLTKLINIKLGGDL